jgi:hypothetical protein
MKNPRRKENEAGAAVYSDGFDYNFSLPDRISAWQASPNLKTESKDYQRQFTGCWSDPAR